MKDLNALNAWRCHDKQIIEHYGNAGDETCGVFKIPFGGRDLVCVASAGEGWDHVSVSLATRCPSWTEMQHVKRMFFNSDEIAMELHVADTDHISLHPFCLHLWRPQDREIPLPPSKFVA